MNLDNVPPPSTRPAFDRLLSSGTTHTKVQAMMFFSTSAILFLSLYYFRRGLVILEANPVFFCSMRTMTDMGNIVIDNCNVFLKDGDHFIANYVGETLGI